MTTDAQYAIDWSGLDADTRATVHRVSTDPLADRDYEKFVDALESSVRFGLISQNTLRLQLVEETVQGPRCSIDPKRYSAFFSRARSDGYIEKVKLPNGRPLKDVCTTSFTGNNGKDQTVYRWLGRLRKATS